MRKNREKDKCLSEGSKKAEYIASSLSKIRHKKWELYIVSRILHLLDDPEIEFVCQQLILRDGDKRRALSILSAISNEVTAASSLVDETLASRIRAAITTISATVSEDRLPPSDVIIEGRRAERIIRQGSILASDSYIADDILANQYLLVDYEQNLYACVHRHLPNADQAHWAISVSCAREGGND